MELKSIPPELLADNQERLARQSTAGRGVAADARTRATARKVAREFEAVFTGFMLKSMRDTVGKDSLTGGGRGEEMFRSLLDQEYALAIAQRGDLGLAAQVEEQLLKAVQGGRQTASIQPADKKQLP
jgi:flagellar protein FlgJ